MYYSLCIIFVFKFTMNICKIEESFRNYSFRKVERYIDVVKSIHITVIASLQDRNNIEIFQQWQTSLFHKTHCSILILCNISYDIFSFYTRDNLVSLNIHLLFLPFQSILHEVQFNVMDSFHYKMLYFIFCLNAKGGKPQLVASQQKLRLIRS